MNDRHQVIGFDESGANGIGLYPDYWTAPFLWSPGKGFTYLGTLGGWDGQPVAINNGGQIVGWSSTIPFDDEAPVTGSTGLSKLGMVRAARLRWRTDEAWRHQSVWSDRGERL